MITLTTFWLSILLLKAFALGMWAAWTYTGSDMKTFWEKVKERLDTKTDEERKEDEREIVEMKIQFMHTQSQNAKKRRKS